MAEKSSEEAVFKIRYLIYIAPPKTHNNTLVEKYVDGNLVDKETPIAETSCNIRFKEKGQFIIGVQAVTVDKDKNIIGRSEISWSNSTGYTNQNPFGVWIEE